MAHILSISALRLSGSLCRRSVTTLLFCTLIVLIAPAAGCEKDTPLAPPPPPACTFSVSATAVSFDVPGGSQQITVSTASHCTWTARTDAVWLSITGGATGTGPGTVTVAASANAGTAERESVLIVADQSVVVRQAFLSACTYDISPSSAWFGKGGASDSIAVSAPAHCSWTAASQAAWLTVTSGATGSGNGTVTYQVAPNTTPFERRATIDVAGLTFTLTQDWDAESCSYSVSPVTFTPCMTTPDLSATITTAAGCPWTAAPRASDSWITVVSGASGSGSGTVTFRVPDNWDPPRSGVVEIRWPAATAGQNLQIAQAGCYYAVSRTSVAFPADGGSGNFDVITFADPIACGGPLQDRCVWTASANVAWIAITTSLPRSGDDRLSFTVAANDGPARSGRITVRDKVVEISQAAR